MFQSRQHDLVPFTPCPGQSAGQRHGERCHVGTESDRTAICSPDHSSSVRIGGDKFDEAIINYVRRNFGSLIGEATAENIKHQIGSAFKTDDPVEIEVRGRNLAEGVPRSFTLNSHEILEALQEPLMGIVSAVMVALEQSPSELKVD